MSLWTWLFPPPPCDLTAKQVREVVHKHRGSMMDLQAAVHEDHKATRKAREEVLAAYQDFETKSERILRMADDAISFIEEAKGREVSANNAETNK